MSKEQNITFGSHWIRVITNDEGSGTLGSNLKVETSDEGDEEYNSMVDAIESLILAHACAGIDIESEAYVTGVETSIEAISNA